MLISIVPGRLGCHTKVVSSRQVNVILDKTGVKVGAVMSMFNLRGGVGLGLGGGGGGGGIRR